MDIRQVDSNGEEKVIKNIQRLSVDWEQDEEELRIYKFNASSDYREMVWDKTGKSYPETIYTNMEQDNYKVDGMISMLLSNTYGQFMTSPDQKKIQRELKKLKEEEKRKE